MLDFHSPRLKHTLFESVMPRHLILLIYLVVVSTILPFQPIHGQVRLTDAEYETYTDHLKQLNIQEVRTNFTSSYTLHVIKVWDSLNRNHHNVIYEKLPAKIWQDIFEKRYARSISNNDQALRLKIAYPLSFICHTRSSFNEGLPVLEFLYANKSKLNKKLYEKYYIVCLLNLGRVINGAVGIHVSLSATVKRAAHTRHAPAPPAKQVWTVFKSSTEVIIIGTVVVERFRTLSKTCIPPVL